MHTKDMLAAALLEAGLPEMAHAAAGGYYDDYLSPLPFPSLKLLDDLHKADTPQAIAIRDRHMNGEFDATVEESEAWADSEAGRAAFAQLMKCRTG